jgi:hypothetical protein
MKVRPPAAAVTPMIAGVAADASIRGRRSPSERPVTVYVFGGQVTVVLWSLNMAAIWLFDGMGWTPELWSGTIILCALAGVALSLLAVPPRRRGVFRRTA